MNNFLSQYIPAILVIVGYYLFERFYWRRHSSLDEIQAKKAKLTKKIIRILIMIWVAVMVVWAMFIGPIG